MPPPEFGNDGSAPPVRSELQVVRRWSVEIDPLKIKPNDKNRDLLISAISGVEQEAFRVVYLDPHWRIEDDEDSALISEFSSSHPSLLGVFKIKYGDSTRESYEELGSSLESMPMPVFRKLQLSSFWQRDPEIRQIPRGVSTKVTVRYKVGATRSRVEEFSDATGIKIGSDKVLNLDAKTEKKTQLTTTVVEESEYASERTLTNDGPYKYRRFAIWHQSFSLSAFQLIKVGRDVCFRPIGEPLTFAVPTEGVFTSDDVPGDTSAP